MDCTKSISLFKTLKLGFLGLLGIFVGHVAKSFLETQTVSLLDYGTIVLIVYCVACYLTFDALESSSMAKKELICDLLTLRMNVAGRKLDKRAA
jgi:hypothetical protein